MVLGIILFMGKVSGAHLNPAVKRRVCVAARLPVVAGSRLHRVPTWRCSARRLVPPSGYARFRGDGSNYRVGVQGGAGFWMELILTFGLVSVILGTASGAQTLGIIARWGSARTSRWLGCGAARSRARR